MRPCISRMVGLVVVAGSVVGTGCGGGAAKVEPSRVEATVTGKVTGQGAPVSKGKVAVTPPGPPYVEFVADIKKDGTYEVKTYVGKNSFSVTGTESPAAGAFYNKTRIEVKEGPNTIDLDLPLKDQ